MRGISVSCHLRPCLHGHPWQAAWQLTLYQHFIATLHQWRHRATACEMRRVTKKHQCQAVLACRPCLAPMLRLPLLPPSVLRGQVALHCIHPCRTAKAHRRAPLWPCQAQRLARPPRQQRQLPNQREAGLLAGGSCGGAAQAKGKSMESCTTRQGEHLASTAALCAAGAESARRRASRRA